MSTSRRNYGTHPDVPDHRDHYHQPRIAMRRLPAGVDLSPHGPPIYNQGSLNACTANAIAAAMWYDEIRQGIHAGSPSRLFIYYNERVSKGLAGSNAPVSLRLGYRSVAKRGACPESMWPYRIGGFKRTPPPRCYAAAWSRRVTSYHRIRREIGPMRACLAEGFPFTFAITVHRSFESRTVARTGRVPMPHRHDPILGGHALLAVGYDHAERCFIVRNSFGSGWGVDGHCLTPYAYLMNPDLAWDFWMARHVADPGGSRRR